MRFRQELPLAKEIIQTNADLAMYLGALGQEFIFTDAYKWIAKRHTALMQELYSQPAELRRIIIAQVAYAREKRETS